MTYNVFGGTLNLTQSNPIQLHSTGQPVYTASHKENVHKHKQLTQTNLSRKWNRQRHTGNLL